MRHERRDFSKLPPVYQRVIEETETSEELRHKLHLEKARFYTSAAGVTFIFAVLVAIIFWHQDPELTKSAAIILQALAAGFIGYLVKRWVKLISERTMYQIQISRKTYLVYNAPSLHQ